MALTFQLVAPISRFVPVDECPSVQLLKYLRGGQQIPDPKWVRALQGELDEDTETRMI